jgi:pyruvate/2-oxoglutarate dehydrogenase complex dihydrolipoamide dehydrogenase (E3) component
MADEHYDAIVIGTSQGGRFLPIELAKTGRKVALVERGQLGGVCVNTGCTPTKTMVASARLAYQARRGAEYGVRTGPVSVDLAAVRERKRAMVAGARQNYASRVAQDGLVLIEGGARFVGSKTVEIASTNGGTRQISASVIVIDAGARPKPLAITGADQVRVLDSTSIMELDEIPEHLIVLGGGYIGLEFGQMFRRFGSEVTIVQSAARVLMIEDDDVSDEVAAILRDEGITVLTSSTPVRIEPADGDRPRLTVRTQDGERQLEGSHLLSAIGRVPNTEALTPEAAGIRLDDRGFIEVDEYLETSVPGVYAMGDIKGAIRVAKLPMNAVVRASETGETRGFMKAVADADSGQILGCAVLGSEGGEIMTMIQIAMVGKLTHTAMADAIFTHPLLAEGLNSLFAMFDT